MGINYLYISQFDLEEYDNLLFKIVRDILNIQLDISVICKELVNKIQYNKNEFKYAEWFNAVKGQTDGIDYLNSISKIWEEVERILGTNICYIFIL